MISLDSRSLDILRLLLESDKPLSAKSISQELNLSPRIVQYRMQRIKGWLNTENINLNSKPGFGFQIEASEKTRSLLKNKFLNDLQFRRYYSPSDRLYIILINLLTSNCPITIKQIQLRLSVSRTTVLKDLQRAQGWLKNYQIQLLKKQNSGCFIDGREFFIRQGLVSLIYQVLGEINLLAIFGNLEEMRFSPISKGKHIQPEISDFLGTLNLCAINKIIALVQDDSEVRFTDQAYILLVLHLAVLTKRINEGKGVKIPQSDIDMLRSSSKFHLAATLGENVQRNLGITVTEPEIAYLSIVLMDAEVEPLVKNPTLNRSNIENYSSKVVQIVDALMKHATLYLHPALWLDSELKESLASHVARILIPSRATTKSFKKNLLLEDVKQIYPHIFKVSSECVETIQKLGWLVNEDEIGFITMHFAAAMERIRLPTTRLKKIIIICNSGIASSKLLAMRILNEFPEVEIKGILSYLEYKGNKADYDHDLVISTVPIIGWTKPTIIVSPLLNRNDIIRIRSIINNSDKPVVDFEALIHESLPHSLGSLLTVDTIELQIAADNWEEVVDRAGLLLSRNSAIESRYIEAMKSILLEHGPYMVIMPGVALLHAYPEDGVRRLCMSLVTLLKPVAFGHKEYDPVHIAFALGALDNNSHLRALSELMALLQDQSAVNAIKGTYLKARVINIISKYSHQ